MGMSDPIPTFTYLISEIKTRHPNLAYMHVIEPRVEADVDRDDVLEREYPLISDIKKNLHP